MSASETAEAVVTPCLLIAEGHAPGVLFQQDDVTLVLSADKADELAPLLNRAAVEARYNAELARTDQVAFRAMLSRPVGHA